MEVSKPSPARTVEPAQAKNDARNAERIAQQKAATQEATERKRQQEQPKPVVNTQGHTTGRLLNVTA